jgi:hypothetical protein
MTLLWSDVSCGVEKTFGATDGSCAARAIHWTSHELRTRSILVQSALLNEHARIRLYEDTPLQCRSAVSVALFCRPE